MASRRRGSKYEKHSEFSVAQNFASLTTNSLINVVDAQNNITEVNEEMLAFSGYRREQLIGQPVMMLYGETHRALAIKIRGELVQGRVWKGETPVVCADGVTRMTQSTVMPLFDHEGRWSGSISVRSDIAKCNNIVLEKINSTALHELRDGIWLLGVDTLQFKYMNRTALDCMKLDEASYKDLSLSDLAEELDVDCISAICARIQDGSETSGQCTAQFNGSQFEVDIKRVEIDGEDDRILVVIQDISERLAQERMKADFISTVSHELRSPLTSIKGSMGLLLSNAAGDLPPKARDLLEIAHRNAERLVLIINDILDLEKIVSGGLEFECQRVDLAELVQEAVRASVVASQRFDLGIETIGAEAPVWVRTDPNRIIQVITNFLSNASKFSRPNGKITVGLVEDKTGVRVYVEDEGLGIPAKDSHKIFERFADMTNSDRAAKGGTGLGLSICKAIVENLDGDIGFESREGEGTTFYFTLPNDSAQATEKSGPTALRVAG
ncbi:ATP-binding protein [Sulfitobacter aestuarii]|uniref:histidine kinase n=1 Tax=Sulfitobacter aestuarii TaxID=2161676 RepID=A0ABW5U3K3_9RHOB